MERREFMKFESKDFLILLVRFYQVALTPLKPLVGGVAKCCRYSPCCSEYAIEALQQHGAWNGSRLAAKRILRCHPWNEAGYDPVPLTLNRKF